MLAFRTRIERTRLRPRCPSAVSEALRVLRDGVSLEPARGTRTRGGVDSSTQRTTKSGGGRYEGEST